VLTTRIPSVDACKGGAMRRRLGVIHYHQAFYQHGVALYNIVIDVDNISKVLKVKFDGNLKEFLANAYTTFVKNAAQSLTIEYDVLAILNVMKDFIWLSSWQYKQFVLSAYTTRCESQGLKNCSVGKARKVLHLVLDLNAATDLDAVVSTARYNIRITAVGAMLLNLHAMYRVGAISDVENFAKKIVEFPKKLMDYINEKISKVGELPLSALARVVIEDMAEYQEILHYNALPIVANDIIQLLLRYQADRVDQIALLKQLVRWVERA
jgi:hypothetical protein